MRYAAAVAIAGVGITIGANAAEQTPPWPNKTLRMICPFAPGGATDIFARIVAQRLQASLKQTAVVDNRGGAGGAIGTEIATKAEPNGYTLLFTSDSPITIGPNLYKNTPYDAMKDLTPLAKMISVVNVLVVNPKLKVNSVSELVAQAKQRKPALTYASSGAGAFGHLTGELFRATTATELVHVPYKGGGPGITALVGGETDLSFATYPSVMVHIRSGRLTLLAVSNVKRSKLLPDTPTIAEAGVRGFGVDNWQGMMAPPKLPRAIAAVLDRELRAMAESRDFVELVNAQGAEADYVGLDAFAAFLRTDSARWKQVIDKNQIRGE
jgi:tripartite-type tricarboxylate transporter receptor subunit TctC